MSYLTPDEARLRTCCGPCHARPTNAQGCSGPACMAWRWAPTVTRKGSKLTPGEELSHERGYCGIAGVPQRPVTVIIDGD